MYMPVYKELLFMLCTHGDVYKHILFSECRVLEIMTIGYVDFEMCDDTNAVSLFIHDFLTIHSMFQFENTCCNNVKYRIV